MTRADMTAAVDRIVSTCHKPVIEGDSYRRQPPTAR
jgi:hypothetical protein